MAKEIGEIKAHGSSKLSSQPLINPKENASAITLKSSRTLDEPIPLAKPILPPSHPETSPPKPKSAPKVSFKEPLVTHIPLPFPTRLAKSKKDEQENEVLETFRKVQVNIPLLDVIKQVPRYVKFFKELSTNKRKLKGNEVVSIGENCSAVLQKKLPPKLKDPGSFTIPCTIGKTRFGKAMLDLGASTNAMPYSVFAS